MTRCSVLFIAGRGGDPQANELRSLGFTVIERDVSSDDAMLLQFPVVVITCASVAALPMVATRLRAKAGFGRRVLVARVPDDTRPETIRSLLLCGLDDVIVETTVGRVLADRIGARIRERPELGCEYPEVPRTPAA